MQDFEKLACQWRTVSRMLRIMRDARFLGVEHRGSEWLTNVFSSPPKLTNIRKDQDSLLSIAEEGKQTGALHASVVLPEFFGPLSQEDIFFGGKQFKRWTKSRSVLRPSQSMRKLGGSILCIDNEQLAAHPYQRAAITADGRRGSKELYLKALTDQRRRISKMKEALYEVERLAISLKNDVSYRR